MSKFLVRINRPVKYSDLTRDEWEDRLRDFFVFSHFRECVCVHEVGERGENPHWHIVLVDPKRRSSHAMREWFKEYLEVSGNAELSVKVWNDEKGKNHYQYLAKGPTEERLVMPIVVVDDLGLMWERLHHMYHDEKVRTQRRGKSVKVTFTQELVDVCKAKSVSTRSQILDELCGLMTRRLQSGDAFWAEKVVWGVYAQLNPEEFVDDFKSAVRSRMNL